jgi:hypothetical protein
MEHDAQVCRRCGNLISDCSNPAIDWHPRKAVCWASATTDLANRHLRERYAGKTPEPDSLHPMDGVRVWVSQIAPPPDEDEFKFR